jgi:hypothetical protein
MPSPILRPRKLAENDSCGRTRPDNDNPTQPGGLHELMASRNFTQVAAALDPAYGAIG